MGTVRSATQALVKEPSAARLADTIERRRCDWCESIQKTRITEERVGQRGVWEHWDCLGCGRRRSYKTG